MFTLAWLLAGGTGCGGRPTTPVEVDKEAHKLIDRLLDTPTKWSGQTRAEYFKKAAKTQAELRELGPAALPAMIDCTKDEDNRIRTASLLAISSAKPDRGVPELIAALNDPDAGVRREAANVLGMVASVRAPGAIIEVSPLPTPSPDVLASAIPPLIAALSDDEVWVCRKAAQALGEFGSSAEPALRQVMQDADGDVRAAALKSLCFVRSDGAIDDLIDALDDPARIVRWTAATWIGILANPDDLKLRRLRPAPLPQLDQSAFAAAVGPLTDALLDKEQSVRAVAIEVLTMVQAPTKSK